MFRLCNNYCFVQQEDQDLYVLNESLTIELQKLKKKKKEKDEIMKALHQYNDIKDATQLVLGRLAILEGVTVAEIHQNYDLHDSD